MLGYRHEADGSTSLQVESVKAELLETREEAKVKKTALDLEHISIEFDHENSENLLLGGSLIRSKEEEEEDNNVKKDLMREIEVYQEKLVDNEQLLERLKKVELLESDIGKENSFLLDTVPPFSWKIQFCLALKQDIFKGVIRS